MQGKAFRPNDVGFSHLLCALAHGGGPLTASLDLLYPTRTPLTPGRGLERCLADSLHPSSPLVAYEIIGYSAYFATAEL